jgi:hypothetical protein
MRSLSLVAMSVALVTFVGCAGFEQPGNTGEAPSLSPRGAVLRWHSRKDADGTIPAGALYREAVALRQRLDSQPQLSGGPTNWSLLGPGNIGGRIRSILIHPSNPSIMWIGSVSGGVWKSTNAGSSWTMLPDLPVVLAVTCMVLDPNDPNTIYAGTGEQAFFDNVEGSSNSAVNVGAGVFKSTDGGASWSQLPSTAGPAWNSVTRLAIDHGNPSIIVASTITGIYRSTDGGTTWSQRTSTKTFDVKIDPSDSSKYVAGRGDGRAQYSTDGGVTWSTTAQFSASATRVELAYAQSSPNIVYAAVSTSGSIRIWRSINGGQTYTQQTTANVVSVLSNYTSALWVDPTNSNTVVTGGLDLYRSTNAGVNFTKVSAWASYPNSAHADHHVIVEHPQFDGVTNRTVYFGNDGGIQRATNVYTVANTSGWTNMNSGLAITQLYGICVNPTSGVVLGGAQDNGTSRGTPTSGVNGWTASQGGDGGFCAADPNDPNYFYMQYQYIGLTRSSNAGQSAGTNIKGTINEPTPNFMNYILLDPNDSNRLYVCGAALWRTNNAKTGSPPTWTSVKPALVCPSSTPTPPHPAHFSDNPPCNISTVAVAKGNSNIVWVGHNNGDLYYTTNGLAGSPSWTRVDQNGAGLPDRWVSRIAIDHVDPNRVTVSFLGFAADNVFRTDNSGAAWSLRNGSGPNTLPPVPVSCIVQHRVVRNAYYAATDLGLFYTEDDGVNWVPAVGGPAIVPIDEIVWRNDKTLFVGTHGRSIWSCDVTPASISSVGTGCGLSTTPVLVAGLPIIGSAQTYTLTNAAPNAPTALALSGGPPNPVAIGPCVLQPNLVGMLTVLSGTTNGAGSVVKNINHPALTSLLGAQLTTQMLVAVAGGPLFGVGELSNGLTMTFGL